jgi:hypothetical protein
VGTSNNAGFRRVIGYQCGSIAIFECEVPPARLPFVRRSPLSKRFERTQIPPKLSELQFIRFDTASGVMRPLRELADALRVDLQWIREHTRLSELGTRWDGRGRPESLLLRGDDIDAAKTWMADRRSKYRPRKQASDGSACPKQGKRMKAPEN